MASSAIQPLVKTGNAEYTQKNNYFVVRDARETLYSSIFATAPKPVSLYTRGLDITDGKKLVYTWTPNVQFVSEEQNEDDELSIQKMKSAFREQTGREVPPVLLIGKNDCSNFAVVLSSLMGSMTSEQEIFDKKGLKELQVAVGDMIKHYFESNNDECHYHAATVVAKDGQDLVTLEADVSKSMIRPEFHLRRGVKGFVNYNSEDSNKGYHVSVEGAGSRPVEKMRQTMQEIISGEHDVRNIAVLLKRGFLLLETPTGSRRKPSKATMFMILLLLFVVYLFWTGSFSRRLLTSGQGGTKF